MPQNLTGPVITPANASAPTSAVILLHGYGANGDDLIGLGEVWRDAMPATVFLAPNAPEELPFPAFGGLQWFPLTLRDPGEYWRGVQAAAPLLDRFINEAVEVYALTPDRVALVGFSQGTMMALHVGLRRRESLAAIIGYSGRLVGPEHLSPDVASSPPVLLVHGSDDEVVPVESLDAAETALAAAEITVESHVRPGLGHGIDNAGLALGSAFLVRHLD